MTAALALIPLVGLALAARLLVLAASDRIWLAVWFNLIAMGCFVYAALVLLLEALG